MILESKKLHCSLCTGASILMWHPAKLIGCSTVKRINHYAKLLKNNILNEVKDAFEKSY